MADGAGGDDEELEAILRSAPPEAWEALTRAADELAADDAWVTWHRSVVLADGTRTLPYPEYSPALDAARSALAGLGVVTPLADWMAWEGQAALHGAEALLSASPADCVRMATALVRGERFSEGTLDAAMADGTLPALLARLRRWHADGR